MQATPALEFPLSLYPGPRTTVDGCWLTGATVVMTVLFLASYKFTETTASGQIGGCQYS